MGLKKKLVTLGLLSIVVTAGVYTFQDKEPEVVDTRYNGAYRFVDGSITTIVPSTTNRVRIRHLDDGQVHSLYHDGNGNFQAADGYSSKDFIASGEFKYSDQGLVTGATWIENGNTASIERIPLHSEEVVFNSGDLQLRGKLTLPKGDGPFPVVVMIHGSESSSAVDYYHLPYMLAANGIAGFKFDKRGTGGSEGEYTQHFPTLAGDVIAAIKLLKSRDDINPQQINLIGFSQGGWIAPFVAKQTEVNSFIVGFGCAVSVKREDRWGYVKRLLDRGFGEAEIALADQMNAELESIIDHGDEDAWDRLFLLRDKYIDEDWFRAIVGSDSMLGFVAEKVTSPGASLVPGFGWKLYYRWKSSDGPNFNRAYDPKVTLREISTPSLWLLAGEDTSVPTPETTEVLDELRTQGKPFHYKVYEGAEHGNVLYETNEAGKRTYTSYAPSYFTDIMDWLKQHNGEKTSPVLTSNE